MSTATLVSPDEYLTTAYHPDVEYADGALIRRNVGTQLHSALQFAVAAYFGPLSKAYGIKGFTECRLRMPGDRYYLPDVMLVERPYPLRPSPTRGKVVTDVPAVVIEIKSPDDRFDEILEKCLNYEVLEVPNIVVLDPDFRRQYVFSGRALTLLPPLIPLHLPKANRNLMLPMDQVFAQMEDSE